MKRMSNFKSNGEDKKKRKQEFEEEKLPRKVLHLRGFPDGVEAADIVQFAVPFGKIRNMFFAKKTHQALLEMDSLDDAIKMVNYYRERPGLFDKRVIYVQFSKYDELDKSLNSQHANVIKAVKDANVKTEDKPTPVLRVLVENRQYPITLNALKQVFSKYGEVLKIVTFVKVGVWQALIQMEDVVAARRAKYFLSGKNIYDECCTLVIEFSRQESIHIKYNNDKSYDFTCPDLPQGNSSPPPSHAPPLPATLSNNGYDFNTPPPPHNLPSASSSSNSIIGSYNNSQGLSGEGGARNQNLNILDNLGGLMFMNQNFPMTPPPPPPLHLPHYDNDYDGHERMRNEGRVLLVSNLNDKTITPDSLFVLFGVYGNVLRIKILYNKKDTALVEYEEGYQARDALENLKGLRWNDRLLNIIISKFDTVKLPKEGSEEPWLTKDFTGSKLHRFRKSNSKNHRNIFPPSPTLHLSNIIPKKSEEFFKDIFSKYGKVMNFKFSPNDKKIAWVRMDSIQSAVDALIGLHNYELAETNHLRVSFTGYHL